MKKILVLILVCFTFVAFTGCGGKKKTQRVDANAQTDLGDKWNDTDSRLVADEMINDCLSRPWLKKFLRKNNDNPPVVIIGKIRNRSHEHINIQTFTKNIEKALLNSGEVEFVAGKAERDELREEVKSQASHASEGSAKEAGEETGANYMLKGTLNSIINKQGGEKVKFYQINMTLIDLQSHKKVWIGEKQIKKLVDQSKYSG